MSVCVQLQVMQHELYMCLPVASCKFFNKSYACVCVFVYLQVLQQEPVTVMGVDMEKFFNNSYTCVCVFVSCK